MTLQKLDSVNTLNKHILTVLAFAAGLLLSCSNQHGSDAVEDSWEVTAILTPMGLGDLGYNDQMYLGLCYVREQLGCNVITLNPASVHQADSMAMEWKTAKTVAGKHKLLILCDGNYGGIVSSMGWENSLTDAILLMDSTDDSLSVYTRYLSLYDACHEVGRKLPEFVHDDSKSAAVVLANEWDQSICQARDGFLLGASECGVKVDTYYLNSNPGQGYSQADSLYHLCYEIAGNHAFLLPLAGGSNNGVYRYGREQHADTLWTCALDSDLSYLSRTIAYGIMKNIDQLLLDFCRSWRESEPLELHASYGLSSEYVNVEVNPYSKSH